MYQEMTANRSSANKHSKTHLIAVCECQFNIPEMRSHLELGEYYGPEG